MAAGLGMYLSAQTRQPHVGLLLPAGAGFVASFYGTLLAGKSVVPINFLLGDKEIAHVIADSGIDTVVTIPQLAGAIEGRAAEGGRSDAASAHAARPPSRRSSRRRTPTTWPC